MIRFDINQGGNFFTAFRDRRMHRYYFGLPIRKSWAHWELMLIPFFRFGRCWK